MSKSKTADIYNKYAKKWTEVIRSGTAIFHVYLEKPAMNKKLPDLKNKTVLCVGCGSGEEVEHLYSLGAKKVIGIDISEKLIDIAKKTYPDFEFFVIDVSDLTFDDNSFDFVYSSLTMHYIDDWSSALRSINKVLKTGGKFLFSITHPFISGSLLIENAQEKSRILGYKHDKTTKGSFAIYGDYLNSHKTNSKINKELIVEIFHKPFSKIVQIIREESFEILDIVEPKALIESKEKEPVFWAIRQQIPEFLILELKKT